MLPRTTRPLPIISMAPLIDIFLILLVFFVVTSTFLHLDMIPLSKGEEQSGAAAEPAASEPVLLRLGADGMVRIGRVEVASDDVQPVIEQRFEDRRDGRILILLAPSARTQALVDVLEAAATSGIEARIVRLAGGGG